MKPLAPGVLASISALALLGCSPPVSPDGGVDAGPDVQAADVVPDGGPPRAECNPLGYPEVCAMPFPSAYYLRDDPMSPTTVRLALVSRSLPVSRGSFSGTSAATLDPAAWNRIDGFSPSSPLLAYFPTRIDPATLTPHTDLARSLTAAASTAIVDMETNERVVHFAEVDVNVSSSQRQTLIIRPMTRLKPGHRYAVVITRAVHTMAGAALAPPPGFQAILDDMPDRDARLATIAPRYPAIFASLQAAGIARADIALAWDYVTASEQHLTGQMVQMRDAALTMAGPDGIGFTITSIDEDYNTNILRRIQGTFRVPLFLTTVKGELSVMNRDANGAPAIIGVYDAPFVAMVPRSAMTGRPLSLMLYGHGLLGTGIGEFGTAAATNNYLQRFINERGFVAVATNWAGLSQLDFNTALQSLSNFNNLPVLTERLQQSLINAMVLFRTARGRFAADAAFRIAGEPTFDPARAYYFGISLGGIMGTSFMGYSPDCDRGVANVPGGNWSVLLQRSANFRQFAIPLADYPAADDRQMLFSLAQSLFDYSDPVNVAPHLLRDRLPGVPEKHYLAQMAVGDSAVNNLATEMLMRSMGIPMLTPTAAHSFGIAEMTGPLDSAFTAWDEHPMPLPPGTNMPAMDNPTHSTVRDLPALKEQIFRFLTPTGRVEHTCDGPCDPG